VAAKALESLGISLDGVRGQVEEIIGQGQQAPSGHIPFTPRAKKVLDLSLREALQLNHDYIGTEHILLGLIREGEGVAAQVLVKLGADLKRVRQQVIQLLSGFPGGKAVEDDDNLDEAIDDLTDQVRAASRRERERLPRLYGAPRELREIRDLLQDIVARLERIEGRLAADDDVA
jgi:ATP-dependent Clp protease ATP-binding subunit ClpA